jgi:hypothetical protein
MKARSFTMFVALAGAAFIQACDNTDSTTEPEVIAQTISNATPEAIAAAAATIQKITHISGVVDPQIPLFGESIGTPNNGNAPGFHATGRREVNWDGVPSKFSNNNHFPAAFFNSNAPRGLVYDEDEGTGLRVSSKHFSELNPTYQNDLIPFSEPRMFASVGTREVEIKFFIPGTKTPAVVQGFGAVVVDVDKPNLSRLQAFDKNGKVLVSITVPVRKDPDEYSLVGVRFSSPVIAKVKMFLGDIPPTRGVNDVSSGGTKDVVALDDFLYSEPQPIE